MSGTGEPSRRITARGTAPACSCLCRPLSCPSPVSVSQWSSAAVRRRGLRSRKPRVHFLEPPAGDAEAVEAAAFRARKRLDGRGDLYVASLSFRTVVYKALCAADQLAPFYADLRDPAVEVQFGIFHQRFSTNT